MNEEELQGSDDQAQTQVQDGAQDGANQQGADESQSDDEGKSVTDVEKASSDEVKTYTVGNRKLSADELFAEHQKLNREFTRKSQKLSEYEKQRVRTTDTTHEAAGQAADQLKVAPEIRDAVLTIVKPEFEKLLDKRDQIKATQTILDSSLNELAKNWDGKEGRPKFDPEERQSVLDAMGDPSNRIYDPKVWWENEHAAEIMDWRIKQAIKDKGGSSPTERTGGTGTSVHKPASKTPKTIKEAGASFLERLRNQES
jgi:hypothetical protein